jgi:hypothetical protein
MGPGRAKLELQKELRSRGWAARIVGLETADRLTRRQITARVVEVLQGEPPAARRTRRIRRPEGDGRQLDPRPERISVRADIEAWLDQVAEPEEPGAR